MCQKTCKALPRNALHVFADAVFTYKMYIKCKGKCLRASSFFAISRTKLNGYLYLGKPLVFELSERSPYLTPRRDVKPCRQLAQKHKLRTADERENYGQLLPLTAGELGNEAFFKLREAEAFKQPPVVCRV